jgi:23S rRNA (cytosine1962-C5)-methyltransferase
VRVVDAHGNLLGQAFWAERSPIALRMLTRREETCDRAFFAERVRRALAARRDRLGGMEAGRLIHGEADLLPGLFVDRYADALALQAVSEGAEARTALWVELLREQVAARLIVAKNDTSARDFEGLPREQRVLDGGPNAEATFVEGQNRFTLDLLADLKTGAFLDQRENHGRAAELVPEGGRALDLFSYHGGFALALGIRAGEVLAVELDEVAAARLAENARENRRPVTVRQENAFDVLRELERAAQRFDVVVLDPPAFAKRKGDLPAATRAYKELNLRALRLVEPGGILITCSCSGRMTPDRFGAVIAEAVADVKRPVQILERRGAAGDHPVLFGVPETEYLKAWVLRVL